MVAEPKISKKKKKVNVQNSPHMALQPLSSFYSARPDVLGHQTLEDFAQMCLSFVWRNFHFSIDLFYFPHAVPSLETGFLFLALVFARFLLSVGHVKTDQE